MKWTISIFSQDGRLIFAAQAARAEASRLAREARRQSASVAIYLRSPTGEVFSDGGEQ